MKDMRQDSHTAGSALQAQKEARSLIRVWRVLRSGSLRKSWTAATQQRCHNLNARQKRRGQVSNHRPALICSMLYLPVWVSGSFRHTACEQSASLRTCHRSGICLVILWLPAPFLADKAIQAFEIFNIGLHATRDTQQEGTFALWGGMSPGPGLASTPTRHAHSLHAPQKPRCW